LRALRFLQSAASQKNIYSQTDEANQKKLKAKFKKFSFVLLGCNNWITTLCKKHKARDG